MFCDGFMLREIVSQSQLNNNKPQAKFTDVVLYIKQSFFYVFKLYVSLWWLKILNYPMNTIELKSIICYPLLFRRIIYEIVKFPLFARPIYSKISSYPQLEISCIIYINVLS
jgi:hypothetical protein